METSPTNPLYIAFFFFLRCLVPLGIMLVVSYLLRKFGLIAKPPAPPSDEERQPRNNRNDQGGLANAHR